MLHALASSGEAHASERQPGPPLYEIALTGIFEITKILVAPTRLQTTLSNVVNLLQSFMQMRHGVVSLFAEDGIPEITVGAGWSEGSDARYRLRLPQRAIDQIVATAIPLVVENVASHPAFTDADREALGAVGAERVSFIGVPIRIDHKVAGTLTVDRLFNSRAQFRLDADVRFLTMVANLITQTVKLHRALAKDRERLMEQNRRLDKELRQFKSQPERPAVRVEGIVGDSAPVRDLLAKIGAVAKFNSTVLLRGESGTGKELFAKALHELSPRAKRPFIKINCAALPESVLESELFGHEKGAFTGAVATRKGRFELADKGTLFLDEIGEISPAFQAKLLRVLQEQEFERVGGSQTVKVDVRVIAATNRNLEEAVAKNEFRADLYYRISVVPLILPPLRDRRGDIPQLAKAFLQDFNTENQSNLAFDARAVDVLMNCGFPGNVRELENCVQRTATLASSAVIHADDFACAQDQCLSKMLWRAPELETPARRSSPVQLTELPSAPEPPAIVAPDGDPEVGPAGLVDRDVLIAAMEKTGWGQAKAARLLGLTPRQVGYALRRHNIEVKRL